ncbi:hypothetical protein JCM10207_001232 [Rhodosporidiobolus poonsookiae]
MSAAGKVDLKALNLEDTKAATAVSKGAKGPHLAHPEEHKEVGLMATDDVHTFEGQDSHERERYKGLWKDAHSTTEAKLNAADAAEALPHHGFLPGDL